ncbi:rhomboid family intramembrane serine protease [Methylocystis bryophila]|uniref:Rhomboid family intramembrane serine protease n=1 Tax=Methylocystis bryophila TaxID=655015 RepID=A0A1W6MY71_9HYPH|nr:rhomboid family intramembrane serine protease [Methylocystis bryophila]ARN82537.1 rhomboid family intramembrane serine protease [Methylocystis bryophila]BDV38740.1 rhomboid family intramembrane serine protease [Methylocystis bryophila]
MVIPLHDDAELRFVRRPIVNWTLIFLNVIVFLIVRSEIFGDPLTVIRGFALIPRVLFGEAQLAKWIVGPPAPLTLLTALFFHSGWLHLIGNMLFLYVLGDNVEDAMGSLHYLLFYLTCGVTSGVVFAYAAPETVTPLVGASGAISGVCAAYLMLYPRATIFGLAAIFPIRAPAWMFVGAWIVLQFVHAAFGEQDHVAWVAHLGGIVAGLLLTPMFARRALAPRLRGRRTPAPAPKDEEPRE